MTAKLTAVVTGGGRGIGLAVARQLLERGCRVVLVTRNQARGEQAAAALGRPVDVLTGDLSVLAEVRSVAAGLLRRDDPVDVLVHNAGVWPTRLVRTPDGVEQAFAVNHLAPFLLNHLLDERLRASQARVVQVSAGLYVKGRVDPDRTPTGLDFHRMRTYCDTKLANLLLVPGFARHWQDAGVTIDAVHPGVIRTELGDPGGPIGLLLKVVKRSWGTPAEGAAPVVAAACEPDGGSGRYFDRFTETALAPVATDPGLAERVWAQAAALTGLSGVA